MKKMYEKPRMEVAEFRFAEHIAASGTQAPDIYACETARKLNGVVISGATGTTCYSYSTQL